MLHFRVALLICYGEKGSCISCDWILSLKSFGDFWGNSYRVSYTGYKNPLYLRRIKTVLKWCGVSKWCGVPKWCGVSKWCGISKWCGVSK